MMILKERDSVVWIGLYLVQHQSFTGETRSWSRGIELGPRPRMEFHYTSELHNQAYTEPKCLFPWLTWLYSLTSHPSPPMFFVRVFPVLSPHLSWDCGLQPGPASAPAPIDRQVGKLLLAAVTWPLAWLLSVRWSVVCCLRLGHWDAYSHPKSRDTMNWDQGFKNVYMQSVGKRQELV